MNDIARTNMVFGIGTTLQQFNVDDDPVYLPCLSYHSPSSEIRLCFPQTYHTLYGGHSTVFRDRVVKMMDNLTINIEIDASRGNMPMVYNCACTTEEIRIVTHGCNQPFIIVRGRPT